MAKRQFDEKKSTEKIRGYRQQKQKGVPQKPFASSATRKQNKRNVPVTRRVKTYPPMVKRQGRKVNVPLRTSGAELQLPAFPQLQLGWRFISGAIFFLSLAVVFSFSSLNTFEVTAINLEGAQRLSTEAILSQIDMVGKAIISIKPGEIEEKIGEAFPSLEKIKVSVGLPASVNIQVSERVPIILWQTDETSLWIDEEGVTFPVRGEAETMLTIAAKGNPPEVAVVDETDDTQEEEPSSILQETGYPSISAEFVEGMLALSDYLPEEAVLQYDPQFGLGWQDPRGWSVYFGSDISEIEMKLAEYEVIITTLQENNLNPALISLEFLHSPFYRMEP
jgi:cell division septal protein FtsQ